MRLYCLDRIVDSRDDGEMLKIGWPEPKIGQIEQNQTEIDDSQIDHQKVPGHLSGHIPSDPARSGSQSFEHVKETIAQPGVMSATIDSFRYPLHRDRNPLGSVGVRQ